MLRQLTLVGCRELRRQPLEVQDERQPIPAAECQQFAVQAQAAVGFSMRAGEDDFTDLTDGSEGRACHIQGSASDQTYAAPGDLVAKLAAGGP